MDNVSINRAQYDIRKHRDGFSKGSKYSFDIHLDFDENDTPIMRVKITRESDGKLIHEQPAHSFDEAEDIVSEWRTQLNLESIDKNMW